MFRKIHIQQPTKNMPLLFFSISSAKNFNRKFFEIIVMAFRLFTDDDYFSNRKT